MTQSEGHDVRRFLGSLFPGEYSAFGTLSEAAADPDGAVVLSGDHGGTIFLTAPARLVRCDTAALLTLVSDLDAVSWMSGDPDIATVAFERLPIGSGVVGGDGGGLVVDGVWTHPRRLLPEVRAHAEQVVLGHRARIDGDLLRLERSRQVAHRYEVRTARPMRSRRPLPWDFDIHPPAVPFPDRDG